jgi:(2S)-methylsuccinyl-CoA dehydrogenase
MSALPAALPPRGLSDLAQDAAANVDALVAEAGRRVRARVVENSRVSAVRLDAEQHAAHGLAWLATYATAIRELAAYAERMSAEARFGETEDLLSGSGSANTSSRSSRHPHESGRDRALVGVSGSADGRPCGTAPRRSRP